jgi:predicted transcriptional regulator
MAKRIPKIPDSELEVLEALWQVGSGSVRDVLTQLQWSGSQWTYATVSTLLQRLEQKGLVTCDKSEFAFVYRAAVSRPAVVDRRLEHLIDKVYQGEPGLLVVHLLKSHRLSSEHRHQVRQILQQMVEGEEAAGDGPADQPARKPPKKGR